MTSCQFISSAVYSKTPFGSSRAVELKETIYQCDSVEQAVQFVAEKEVVAEKCNVVAFGETHPRSDRTTYTTLMLYAQRIIPIGAKQVISEMFYADSVSKQDIFPPQNYNSVGLRQLLKRAEKEKVSLFGGGPKKDDPEACYGSQCLGEKLDQRSRKITQRMQEQIVKLCGQEGTKRVDAYTGDWRNDVFPPRKLKQGISFAWYFRKQKKTYQYIEVDLLSPEIMAREKVFYPYYSRWLTSAIPLKGAMLISRGLSSYAIIVPTGTLDL